MRRLLVIVGMLLPTVVYGQAIDCQKFPLECGGSTKNAPAMNSKPPKFGIDLQLDLSKIVKPPTPKIITKTPATKPQQLPPEPKPAAKPAPRPASDPAKRLAKTPPTPSRAKPAARQIEPSWINLPEVPVLTMRPSDMEDVPGQYIIGFNAAALGAAGLDLSTISVADLAARLGLGPSQLISVQRRFMQTAIIAIPPDAVAGLQQNGLVARLSADTQLKSAGNALPLSWGLDRLDSPVLPLDGKFDRSGGTYSARVYIFDTAIEAWPEEFGTRLVTAVSFNLDIDSQNKANAKCRGHGTEMASLIAGATTGAAPLAELVSLAVLPCGREETGRASSLIEAAEWLLVREADLGDGKPVIANMSLIGKWNAEANRAVKILTQNQVAVVVAAGNEGRDACQFSPASAPEAITVAAVGPNDETPGFSNFGTCVKMQAPGRLLTAVTEDENNHYVAVSGTSGATALVSGILARSLSQKGSDKGRDWLTHNAMPAAYRKGEGKRMPLAQAKPDWAKECRLGLATVLQESAGKDAAQLQKLLPDTPVLVLGTDMAWANILVPGGTVGWVALAADAKPTLLARSGDAVCMPKP